MTTDNVIDFDSHYYAKHPDRVWNIRRLEGEDDVTALRRLTQGLGMDELVENAVSGIEELHRFERELLAKRGEA